MILSRLCISNHLFKPKRIRKDKTASNWENKKKGKEYKSKVCEFACSAKEKRNRRITHMSLIVFTVVFST